MLVENARKHRRAADERGVCSTIGVIYVKHFDEFLLLVLKWVLLDRIPIDILKYYMFTFMFLWVCVRMF